MVLLMVLAGACFCSADSSPKSDESENANDPKQGPKIELGYRENNFTRNSIEDFMYFVPMISPVKVTIESSMDNSQYAVIKDYKKEQTGSSFKVYCEFEMKGQGSYQNNFDPASIIERGIRHFDKPKPLTNILEYIKFEGAGTGSLVIRGSYKDGEKIVEAVDVNFNAGGGRSPVTVGLYSVKPNKEGEYLYKNRYDSKVARINKLTFRRYADEKVPEMGIELNSFGKNEQDAGSLWGALKGAIANLFIDPLEVNPKGNKSMLDFGLALANKKDMFQFPHAENLVETDTKVAEADEGESTG